MSKILKVNEGDYRIKVPSGNTITLDTGSVTGSVVITGNLDIKGQTTTIESTNATIKDNIIVLNSGETHTNGNGITLVTSGIQIDRGKNDTTALTANMLFDESVSHYNPVPPTNSNGTFTLTTTSGSISSFANLKLSSIELNGISSLGTDGIVFNLGSTNTTITIANSTYGNTIYESRLTDASLTTKLYVSTYVVSGKLRSATNFTPFAGAMADVDTIYKKSADIAAIPGNPGTPAVPGTIKSRVETTVDSTILFKINETQRAIINTDGLSVDTINLFGNTIKNVGSGSPLVKLPLILQSDANLVEVNAVLTLDDQTTTDQLLVATTAIDTKTKIYSKDTEGPGRTGIYFTNNNTYGSNSYNNDELVSRNRAVLLSMLF